MADERDDRAGRRYKKKDASTPKPAQAAEVDPAQEEPLGGPDAGPGDDDPYMAERSSVMARHHTELRDMARQHRGEHRSVMSRHEKEIAEMMTRHMGGTDRPTMGEKDGEDE